MGDWSGLLKHRAAPLVVLAEQAPMKPAMKDGKVFLTPRTAEEARRWARNRLKKERNGVRQ